MATTQSRDVDIYSRKTMLSAINIKTKIFASLVAIVSASFMVVFVQFINLADEGSLKGISESDVLRATTQLDLFWLIQQSSFWQLGTHFSAIAPSMYFNIYTVCSLLVFSSGLYVFQRVAHKPAQHYFSLMYIAMGWAHLACAKIVLMTNIPLKLAGPVMAVGVLSVIYFSLAGVLLDGWFLLRDRVHA